MRTRRTDASSLHFAMEVRGRQRPLRGTWDSLSEPPTLTRLKAMRSRGLLVEIGTGPHDPKRQYVLASGQRLAKLMMRRPPIENGIELTFSPGPFIRDRACFSFVSDLEAVDAKMDALTRTDPAHAAQLYETFRTGCHEEAEELIDSSGVFRRFTQEFLCRCIKAYRTSGASVAPIIHPSLFF